MTFLKAALMAGIAVAWAGAAQAGVYDVSVGEGLAGGSGFNTTNTNPFAPASFGSNTAGASFTYTGSLDFSDTQANNSGPSGDLNTSFGFSTANISGYSGSGTVNSGSIADFASLGSFLASSGSASNFAYGSWYAIDLGNLAAGTVLTITHDDGVSVYQGGASLGQTVSGPTSQTTDNVTVGTGADTMLYYSRQNGTPSILEVAVPEPMSLTLLGSGLLGLGLIRRRKSGKA